MTMEFTKQILNLIIEGEIAIIFATFWVGGMALIYEGLTEFKSEKAFYEAETKYYNELMKKEETTEVKKDEQPQVV